MVTGGATIPACTVVGIEIVGNCTVKRLSSTEILIHGSSSWTNSAPLPTHRAGLRGATLNNKIVITGDDMWYKIVSFIVYNICRRFC